MVPEAIESPNSVLRVEHVSKTYTTISRESVLALDDVSLDIRENEVLTVIGPSGCGKSTLLRLIAGLEEPTSGTIERQDGRAPFRVGFMFQDASLMRWRTIYDNVKLPLEVLGKKDEGEIVRLLKMVQLTGFERKYPFELSGGMQRRVAMARALVHKPSILLLDEPLTGVDELTKEALQAELMQIIRAINVTAVHVTHDIDQAVYFSDRVLVMSARPGKIIGEIDVQLPRERKLSLRTEQAFYDYCKRLRQALRLPTD
jgi:NitT/TauT family transport system ATP-binding protein